MWQETTGLTQVKMGADSALMPVRSATPSEN